MKSFPHFEKLYIYIFYLFIFIYLFAYFEDQRYFLLAFERKTTRQARYETAAARGRGK